MLIVCHQNLPQESEQCLVVGRLFGVRLGSLFACLFCRHARYAALVSYRRDDILSAIFLDELKQAPELLHRFGGYLNRVASLTARSLCH